MIGLDLTGRNALVCGASQGIGAASAKALALAGAKVTLLARNEEQLKKVLSELPGQDHRLIVGDLTKPESLTKKITDRPIHIFVHNSGGPKGGPLLQAHAEEFLTAFHSHLLSAQILSQALIPAMQAEKYGRIINIISTSVKTPLQNLGVSNTIRAAMANWAKTLANEIGAYGITVNNVLPGFTLTSRLESLRKATAERLKVTEAEVEKTWLASIPAARFGKAEETAAAIAFLASPLAGYINGINLPVDGGRTPSL
jgi:3-oxoacyl-[acyl-carrier protein] reductase